MKRFTVLALAALIGVLAGCESYKRDNNVTLAYMQGIFQQLRNPATPVPEPLSRAQLDALPGPILQAEIESRGTFARLAFLAANGPYQTWSSADSATITLREGVLVATRALGNDLMSADVVDILRMLRDPSVSEAARVHRYIDGLGHLYTRTYRCEVTGREPDRLEIAGTILPVTRITEHCIGAGAEFENLYWLERDGRIRAGRHWVSPDIGHIGLVLLKG
ncbi:group 4 capsule polysaccharide lipoprotein GfcB/YjbF [Rhodovulum bhavnagarense]|uniref:Group 4 capsule polysaccharide lipoprotein GfcB/YjbF n=1 Tax=Rhodovulum bhavnagarense TaxID=992286 RepID=A0A4V2SVZ0_9RHOB|nr:YjbF family lipoprotein [Rhodovulum bhavnagarense]TCP60236.1 group 4 capsule polysaccharide lipoprotein GfcB/YjbF [Rhodovulum bhavnagarense]